MQGTIRLCDMRQSALCDSHSKMFEEPEDPTNRSFFSEIISSISDVKFSNSGRYMISRWGGFWLHSAKLILCHTVWFQISYVELSGSAAVATAALIKNVTQMSHPLTFPGTIYQWKFGTCIWSRNQLRLSPSTSTSAPSSAASMKTTASLTSLRWFDCQVFNTDMFLINWLTECSKWEHMNYHPWSSKYLIFLTLFLSCFSAAGMELTRRSWLAATTTSSGGFYLLSVTFIGKPISSGNLYSSGWQFYFWKKYSLKHLRSFFARCVFRKNFVKLFICRMFDRSSRKEVTLEASREVAKPKTMLKPRKVP